MIHEPLSILLIEDTHDDEQLALRALRSTGLPLVVRVARDGERALRALGLDCVDDRGTSIPDLVISDLKMPKVNGDEVLRRMRSESRLRDVPFIVFSSSDEESGIARCMELGATAYAVKPVDFVSYLQCVEDMVRKWLPVEYRGKEPFCVIEQAPLPNEREASYAPNQA